MKKLIVILISVLSLSASGGEYLTLQQTCIPAHIVRRFGEHMTGPIITAPCFDGIATDCSWTTDFDTKLGPKGTLLCRYPCPYPYPHPENYAWWQLEVHVTHWANDDFECGIINVPYGVCSCSSGSQSLESCESGNDIAIGDEVFGSWCTFDTVDNLKPDPFQNFMCSCTYIRWSGSYAFSFFDLDKRNGVDLRDFARLQNNFGGAIRLNNF